MEDKLLRTVDSLGRAPIRNAIRGFAELRRHSRPPSAAFCDAERRSDFNSGIVFVIQRSTANSGPSSKAGSASGRPSSCRSGCVHDFPEPRQVELSGAATLGGEENE